MVPMGRAKRTLALLAIALSSCSSQVLPAATPTLDTVNLRVYVTTATMPLFNELSVSFRQMYPESDFETAVGDYEAMMQRILAEEETAYLITNHLPLDSPLWAAPIGQDGIAIITHLDNPIANLSIAQLRSIYEGQTVNWGDIGGVDSAIMVISREDGSGTRAEFEQAVMGSRRTTQRAQIAPSSAAMVASVARIPGSIGYVSMGYLDDTVKALTIEEVAPTRETVYDNSYPLRSPLYIVGRAEPEFTYRLFVAWAQSPAGQAIVGRHYAPLLRP